MCRTRTMQRRAEAAGVRFECPCGHSEPGGPESRKIRSGAQRGTSTAEKYGTILRCAPFSNTMLRVAQECKKCGLPYLTQVSVGDHEITRCCDCGYRAQA